MHADNKFRIPESDPMVYNPCKLKDIFRVHPSISWYPGIFIIYAVLLIYLERQQADRYILN